MNFKEKLVVIGKDATFEFKKDADKYTKDNIEILVETKQNKQGKVITLQLNLKKDCYIDFIGFDLGLFHISTNDNFFGDVFGFISDNSIVSAVKARQEKLNT